MVNSMTMPLVLGTSEGAVYGNRFRQKRLNRFLSLVDEIVAVNKTCRIVDVGGKVAYWLALEPFLARPEVPHHTGGPGKRIGAG